MVAVARRWSDALRTYRAAALLFVTVSSTACHEWRTEGVTPKVLLATRPAVGQGTASHTRKSALAAIAWSLGGTVVPCVAGALLLSTFPVYNAASPSAALVLAGGVVGPSLGHFYTGRPLRAAATLALRAALVAGALAAGTDKSTDVGAPSSGEALLFLAGVASGVVDIATASSSARSYNRRWGLSLVPVRFAPRPRLALRFAVPF
jgi:hypothetical protein